MRDTATPTGTPLARRICDLSLNGLERVGETSLETILNNLEVDQRVW